MTLVDLIVFQNHNIIVLFADGPCRTNFFGKNKQYVLENNRENVISDIWDLVAPRTDANEILS